MGSSQKGSYGYLYITTNKGLKVLYTGISNDLGKRLIQHREDAENNRNTFAGRYNCYHLVYYEKHTDIKKAIAREKEIKGWTRAKKKALIESMNPNWSFLNYLFE